MPDAREDRPNSTFVRTAAKDETFHFYVLYGFGRDLVWILGQDDHIRNLSLFKTSPLLLIKGCIGSVPGGHPHSAADRHTLGRIGMIHILVYPQNRVGRGARSVRPNETDMPLRSNVPIGLRAAVRSSPRICSR